MTYTEERIWRKIEKLKSQRDRLISDGETLNDGALRAGRDFTPEEHRRFDAIMSEVDTINDEIRKGEDLIIAGRPSGRNEAWRARTFTAGFVEKLR